MDNDLPDKSNSNLIATLVNDLEIPSEKIENLLSLFINVAQNACKNLDSFAIPGFGTFSGQKNAEHIVTDSLTGSSTLYPPCIEMNFKSSVLLRKKLNL